MFVCAVKRVIPRTLQIGLRRCSKMSSERTVSFNRLQDSTKEDIVLMAEEYADIACPEQLTTRALGMLNSQAGIFGGGKVDLLEHGLQTATRAYHDSADEETVVCCLLHDIGEVLSPSNHGEIPAAILKPFISERNYWILANHEVFQGYYYYHFLGADQNTREVYKDNLHYQATVDFCEKYDAPSFDPDYKSLPLDFFRPMVLKVFSRKPYFNCPNHPKAPAVTGDIGLEKLEA